MNTVILRKLPLLVCDPSLYVVNILRRKLGEQGFEVYAALNAEDAIHLALEVRPAVILMDLVLPGTDGFSLIRHFHREPQLKDCTLIVHSALNLKENIVRAVQYGAANYIVKPASFQTVLGKIQAELAKRKIKQAAPSREAAADAGGKSWIDDPATEAMPVADRLVALTRQCDRLLALPQAVEQAIKASKDPKTGAEQLARVIESDAAVTAAVLRKANAAAIAGAEPVIDARDAIVRIGFRQTIDLVAGMSVIRNFPVEEKSLGFQRLDFWEHCLATAISASLLAERSGLCDASEAFVAGLLHDLGKMILDECIPGDLEKCVERACVESRPLHEVCRELLGFGPAELTQSVLAHWNFPEYLRMVLQECHAPHDFTAAPATDWEKTGRVVQIAHRLVKAMGYGNPAAQWLEPLPRGAADAMRLSASFDGAFRNHVNRELDAYRMFLTIDKPVARGVYASSADRARIVLCDMESKPVNVMSLYLERHGFLVEPMLLAAAKDAVRFEGLLMVVEAMGAGDVEAIQSELRTLPESVPVLFVADAPRLLRWKQINMRKRTELMSLPMTGGELLRKIANLTQEMP